MGAPGGRSMMQPTRRDSFTGPRLSPAGAYGSNSSVGILIRGRRGSTRLLPTHRCRQCTSEDTGRDCPA